MTCRQIQVLLVYMQFPISMCAFLTLCDPKVRCVIMKHADGRPQQPGAPMHSPEWRFKWIVMHVDWQGYRTIPRAPSHRRKPVAEESWICEERWWSGCSVVGLSQSVSQSACHEKRDSVLLLGSRCNLHICRVSGNSCSAHP